MGGELAVLAVLAALEHRDRTGEGQFIDLSMQDIAVWLTQTRWNSAAPDSTGVMLECFDGFLYVEDGSLNAESLQAIGHPTDTRAQRHAALTSAGVRSAPVNTVAELAVHPMTKARRLWFESRGPDGEAWPLLGSPLALSRTRPRGGRPIGPLDGDRDAILKEWLGLARASVT
jgi:crotonobetainyl-CoA:carnitine CoA-transferase CaiB-like acyl-CoA transferase